MKTSYSFLLIVFLSIVSIKALSQCKPNARAREMESNIKGHGAQGWETITSKYVSMYDNTPTQIDFQAEPGYYYEAFVTTGYYAHGVMMALDGNNKTLGKAEDLNSPGPSLPFQTSTSGTHYIAFNIISDKYSSHCVIVSVNRKKI